LTRDCNVLAKAELISDENWQFIKYDKLKVRFCLEAATNHFKLDLLVLKQKNIERFSLKE
tara:strand:- start:132 stop:311 length:180 start_codon:yes stop_codon:yes gene_type:complete